jgi:ATP-dependent Clp protease adaptor protein ClpS
MTKKASEYDEVGSVQEARPRIKEPPLFAVILHNDDYTTMEFVMDVLKIFFRKGAEEAAQIMLKVHKAGQGTAGTYCFEIAETKVVQVKDYAREHGFPLRCSMEPVPS